MTVLDKREELMNVTGAINRVFSGDEIPENAFLGVSLHSGEYGGSWPEGWFSGSIDASEYIHITQINTTKSGGTKIDNFLATDTVSGANKWMEYGDAKDRGINPAGWGIPMEVPESEVNRWEKMFLRDNPGSAPYLKLEVKEGARKVVVPTSAKWLDSFVDNTYFTLADDYMRAKKAITGYLSSDIGNNAYRIRFQMVDGTMRELVTSFNSEFMKNYYGAHVYEGLLSNPDGESQQEETLPKEYYDTLKDSQLMIRGAMKVIDLEAPIKEGVWRQINIWGIKKVDVIPLGGIDQSFTGFDPIAFVQATSNITDQIVGVFSEEELVDHGIKVPAGNPSVADFVEKSLKYAHTASKRWLAEELPSRVLGLDMEAYLPKQSTVDDIF